MSTNKRIFCVLGLFLFLFSCKKDKLPVEDIFTTVVLKDNKFPDFSYAGYKRNEAPIPNFPVVKTLEPQVGDNYQYIQNAIDEVAKMPLVNNIRGTILLKAGKYQVSKELKIQHNGIVLRGEGQGLNGTVLIGTLTFLNAMTVKNLQTYAVVSISGNTSGFIDKGQAKSRITKDVFVGESNIVVEDYTNFTIGDTVVITRTPNEAWIDFIGMRQYGWTSKYYEVAHQRIIKNINGNIIEVDVPMVDAIEERFGGGFITSVKYEGRIENSGIENIRFQSVYAGEEDENHTWSAVILRGTNNCWVRNITAENFSFSAVALLQADYTTVQDCAILNFKSNPWGDRRYSFYINIGSTGNLFQRCYADGGRHDFVTGAKVAGPNVFLDCYAINTISDTGPHHRWATGTLYDNIYAGMIYARNAKDSGSGHGWTGAYNMFWNNQATMGFLVENPPGAINWLIGSHGKLYTKSNSYIASNGIPVLPRSIFLEQLRERLGEAAINRITIPAQRGNGPIWDQLSVWAGSERALVNIN